MDISVVGNNSIKLKGKKATFVVDPEKGMSKTSSDAIILLDGGRDTDVDRVTDSRITIAGPGGYEVGGVKISGTKTPKGTFYRLLIDDISVFLGIATDAKIEGFSACQVVIANANSDFDQSFIATLEPKMAVLYGDKRQESANLLGAENVSKVSKISITKDKLPEKMEVVVLG